MGLLAMVTEPASVVRYLGSQFDLSLSRVFASVSEGAAGADGRP